jgi:hypothetical protein
MKAALEFNLPDETVEFRLACKGASVMSVINKTLDQLRHWLKYGHEFKTANDALEAVQKFMYNELNDKTNQITEL